MLGKGLCWVRADLVKEKIRNGETISSIAQQFGTSRQTIMRVRNHA